MLFRQLHCRSREKRHSWSCGQQLHFVETFDGARELGAAPEVWPIS